MAERAGTYGDARLRVQGLALLEVVETEISLKDFQRHRKQRRAHHLLQHALDAHAVGDMAGMDAETVARIESGAEMRQAADMVVMRMGQEKIGVDPPLLLQRHAERTQTRSRIEQQQMRAAKIGRAHV